MADITISIAPAKQVLEQALSIIFANRVHEEPTIRIIECWSTKSIYNDDKDNLNKYWSRSDAQEIHGTAIGGKEHKE